MIFACDPSYASMLDRGRRASAMDLASLHTQTFDFLARSLTMWFALSFRTPDVQPLGSGRYVFAHGCEQAGEYLVDEAAAQKVGSFLVYPQTVVFYRTLCSIVLCYLIFRMATRRPRRACGGRARGLWQSSSDGKPSCPKTLRCRQPWCTATGARRRAIKTESLVKL